MEANNNKTNGENIMEKVITIKDTAWKNGLYYGKNVETNKWVRIEENADTQYPDQAVMVDDHGLTEKETVIFDIIRRESISLIYCECDPVMAISLEDWSFSTGLDVRTLKGVVGSLFKKDIIWDSGNFFSNGIKCIQMNPDYL